MLFSDWWLRPLLLAVLGPALLVSSAGGVSATGGASSRVHDDRSPAVTVTLTTPTDAYRCLVP